MGKDKAIETGIGSSSFYEKPSILGVESKTKLKRLLERTRVGRHTGNSHGNYPQRVKIPFFKGAFDEDADTHLARFEEMLRANHEQNDTAQLELFPSSLDKDTFTWYTQFPTNHFQLGGYFARVLGPLQASQGGVRFVQHLAKPYREEGGKRAELHRQTLGSHEEVDHPAIGWAAHLLDAKSGAQRSG